MNKPALPRKLNIGSGNQFLEDCLNADVRDDFSPDWVVDICQPLSFGARAKSPRFGGFKVARGMFDAIVARHVLEHLPEVVTAMTNFLELLSDGGNLQIEVPYDLSYGAWQDPTHVRAFNERSWFYFTHRYWYLGWEKERFDMTELYYIPGELGRKLLAQGMPLDEVLLRPRAIDAMKVNLRKRALTEAEVEFGRQQRLSQR